MNKQIKGHALDKRDKPTSNRDAIESILSFIHAVHIDETKSKDALWVLQPDF